MQAIQDGLVPDDDASNDSARASEAEGPVTDAQDDGIIANEV